jgi:FtsH-binding integral membrane protein
MSSSDFIISSLACGIAVGMEEYGVARVTFFIAATMFGVMSLCGYVTTRDLSHFDSIFSMGLTGIVVAVVFNLFLGSSELQAAISIIGVLAFTGLTAYDALSIKALYVENLGRDAEAKLAVLGAPAGAPPPHRASRGMNSSDREREPMLARLPS